jgi:predicted DCC family thiol-disulfide oxidoreductase YuxK
MKKIILFDGFCNLCGSSADFIKKRDRDNLFTYISLQSKEGQDYLKQYNLPTDNFNTVVFIDKGVIYTKSTAILMVFQQLPTSIRYLSLFLYVPKFIRDFFYKLIAKSRYFIFGKRKECKTFT